MMAFFLVMWLVDQSPSVKAAVAGYFRDPGVFETHARRRRAAGRRRGVEGVGRDAGRRRSRTTSRRRRRCSSRRRSTCARRWRSCPSLKALEDRIEITVTPEGLRIELLETAKNSFFAVGSADLLPETVQILAVISQELGTLGNAVALEGHTDSRAYADSKGYGNWELSTDRANSARRAMERFGLRMGQIDAVRGYADTRLRTPKQPLDAATAASRSSSRTARKPQAQAALTWA